jgi:hypothetical protein
MAVLLEFFTVDCSSHPAFRFAAADYFNQALPVTAETKSRNHKTGPAASAVFHVGVVIKYLARIYRTETI